VIVLNKAIRDAESGELGFVVALPEKAAGVSQDPGLNQANARNRSFDAIKCLLAAQGSQWFSGPSCRQTLFAGGESRRGKR